MLDSTMFSHIIPEIVIAISVLLLTLCGSFFNHCIRSRFYPIITILVLFVASYFVATSEFYHSTVALNFLFVSSAYTSFSKLIVLIASAGAVFLTLGYSKLNNSLLKFELYVMMLLSVLGMMIIISSNDLMVLYLGLELLSLSLYTIVASNRTDGFSSEAGLKYFILGAVASAILLYGASLIYGFTGTTNFSLIDTIYRQYASGVPVPIGVLIGVVLVLSAMCFKIAAAPFHMWAPDVYQGAPLPVTAFLSTAPKAASVFLLAKLLIADFDIWHDAWRQVIAVVSCLSLAVGALGALFQSNIKRLLAYSSIGHIGFILIGLLSYDEVGMQAAALYLCIYITMNLGLFAFVAMLQGESENFDLSIFKGLSKTNPIISLSVSVLLLSMAGIPPLAGFLAKFYIIYGAVKSSMYFIAIFAMVTAVISTFYYLRIIKFMYFDNERSVKIGRLFSVENIIIASFATTFNILLIIFPISFNQIVSHSVKILFK